MNMDFSYEHGFLAVTFSSVNECNAAVSSKITARILVLVITNYR